MAHTSVAHSWVTGGATLLVRTAGGDHIAWCCTGGVGISCQLFLPHVCRGRCVGLQSRTIEVSVEHAMGREKLAAAVGVDRSLQ